MDEKEFNEIIDILKKAGWEPMVCDTPLPLYTGKANCGAPLEPGEGTEDMIMFPRALLKWNFGFYVYAQGDSMKDVGIEEGDMLRVDAGRPARDNDIVVACLDGEITVKTLMTDEEGELWLVPANDAYSSICLSDKPNTYILGVVAGAEKRDMRMPAGTALKSIHRSKKSAVVPLTDDMIAAAVEEISHDIVKGRRKWISVFRPLKERGVEWASDYEAFCDKVSKIVPHHPYLPLERELRCMDVLSFTKPVRLWDRNNAPVKGKRFNEYLKLAQKCDRLLREKCLNCSK